MLVSLSETVAGSLLCDPWCGPAFFGSWFPFLDNRQLDWDVIGRTDYLYISLCTVTTSMLSC